MAARWTLDRAKELFKSRGCELLSTEYVSDRAHLKYVATCGHEHSVSLANFRRGKGDLCRACRYKANGIGHSLGCEAIKEAFESEGCVVLNDSFRRITDPVRYIARCGHENVSDYAHFVNQGLGRVCTKCSHSVQYDYDWVREQFQNAGCELLEPIYVNCKTLVRFRAACGHESITTFDVFRNSKGRSNLCSACFRKFCYENPGLVDVRHRPEVHEWKVQVFVRDDFKCQACGKRGGRLNAHHKNGWNLFPDERFDLGNGVTLCETCHKRFHNVYGKGNNTKEQYEEWVTGNTEVSA